MAGALGVELGGPLHRQGRPVEMPRLGDPRRPLEPVHIVRATALMLVTSGLAAALFLGARWALLALQGRG
jgi:adenosylcobinamide-phosphate synthase